MTIRTFRFAFLLTCLSAVTLLPSAKAEISEARFKELHTELQPEADEPWRTIPWKIDLIDAQQLAARENKPIFIWAMDGHPLGCT
ncbi:MAG: hypothetical protein NXI22_03835 [bacterium]|nr:hypothetical protein [bacterium]